MATEIKMNPEELRGQAARLAKISNRMQDITNKTQGAMSAMVGAVSPSLVMNLDWKGKMLLTGLESLTKSLQLGEQTAINAANALEDTDKNIGKKPSEIIEDIISTVNTVKDNMERITAEKEAELRQQQEYELFSERVENMKKTEPFIENTYWGMNSYVSEYKGISLGGSSCWAMAYMMQIETMGQRGTPISVSGVEDIQYGDVITYYGPNVTYYEYGHTVCVLGKTDEGLLIGEGNGAGEAVHYRTLPYSGITELRGVYRVTQ